METKNQNYLQEYYLQESKMAPIALEKIESFLTTGKRTNQEELDMLKVYYSNTIKDILKNEIPGFEGWGNVDEIELKNGKYLILTIGGNKVAFNLEKIENGEGFYLGSYDEDTQKEKESLNLEYLQEQSKDFQRYLNAMEEIFEDNDGFITSGFLDEEDVLKTGKFGNDLKGKNIKEIQVLARACWHNIVKAKSQLEQWGEDFSDNDIFRKVNSQEETYLKYIVGMGDKYEGGADLLVKTQNEMNYLINRMVENNSKNGVKGLFKYYEKTQSELDDNLKQGRKVKLVYKDFISKLNAIILAKLIKLKKEGKATENDLLKFAKLVTGRGIDVDKNLQDTEIANLIINNILTKDDERGNNNSLLNKMAESGYFDVKENIGSKKPAEVITDFLKNLEKLNPEFGQEGILFSLGFGGLVDLNPIFDFKDLNVQQKIQILALYEITKKLAPFPANSSQENKEEMINTIFSDLKESFKNKLTEFLSNFKGWSSLDTKKIKNLKDKNGEKIFTELEVEALELFYNMNGIGVFNNSDEFNNGAVKLAQVALPAIGLAIAAGAGVVAALPTGGASLVATGVATSSLTSLLASGAAAGAAGSIGSWILDDRGFDTSNEMIVDLGSDLALGTTTGALGMPLLSKVGSGFKAIGLTRIGEHLIKGRAGAIAIDTVITGMGTEFVRMNFWIDRMYHIDPNHLYEKDETLDEIF